ncbi:MAG: DNA methyltransferase [Gammaproteobacteria bacterium]|nr:DNA methyltransferase [Gammaproteobacteria bacterium]
MLTGTRRPPGEIRDAVLSILRAHPSGVSVSAIIDEARRMLDDGVRESSVRSYLRLNTPRLFHRLARGQYQLAGFADASKGATNTDSYRTAVHGNATLIHADCLDWLKQCMPNSIHAVVTDPPYGLVEYSPKEQSKLRKGKGGVWRLPPSFDGVRRSPLPRFTVLSPADRAGLGDFFAQWAAMLAPALVPGANIVIASNPLLSYIVAGALAQAGLERRGEIARLVTTMRGGDRPKGAHEAFADVSVMPRSMWEPWLVFRKPLEGRVQDNLRKWNTGGFRRPSETRPFGDVIRSAPTRKAERALAPHPTLKPQSFLRQLVRGVLPLGEGVVLDPFCGAGSTLAAATRVGYPSIGLEKDPEYFELADRAIPQLVGYDPNGSC